MAVAGVLKPININQREIQLTSCVRKTSRETTTNAPLGRNTSAGDVARLTESNFFVESNAAGSLFGQDFLGGKEHALLLLEGFFSLKISHLW